MHGEAGHGKTQTIDNGIFTEYIVVDLLCPEYLTFLSALFFTSQYPFMADTYLLCIR